MQRALCNPLRSLLLCDRHLPPSSKPVYGTVVLPVFPLPTNVDSRALFFSRTQKRALESTELAYRKERTSRQRGFIYFLLLVLLPLYFYILLGHLLPSICHPNEPLFEKAKNS